MSYCSESSSTHQPLDTGTKTMMKRMLFAPMKDNNSEILAAECADVRAALANLIAICLLTWRDNRTVFKAIIRLWGGLLEVGIVVDCTSDQTDELEKIFSNVVLGGFQLESYSTLADGQVDREPTHGTSFNGQKQQRIDITADALYNEKQENLRVWLLKFLISKKPVPEWPRSSMFKRRLITADQASVFMEMMSDHNSSDLAPQRQEMSVENVSSGLVPQGQKASDYDNSDPVAQRQNLLRLEAVRILLPTTDTSLFHLSDGRGKRHFLYGLLKEEVYVAARRDSDQKSTKALLEGYSSLVINFKLDCQKKQEALQCLQQRQNKAQDLKTKTSANSDLKLSRTMQKYEHVGSKNKIARGIDDKGRMTKCHYTEQSIRGESVASIYLEYVKEARSCVQDLASGEIWWRGDVMVEVMVRLVAVFEWVAAGCDDNDDEWLRGGDVAWHGENSVVWLWCRGWCGSKVVAAVVCWR
ncbi:hypothetical protein Tco_0487849 [Tanacetum coccineum]